MMTSERPGNGTERPERPERPERSERSYGEGRRNQRRAGALTVVVDERGIESALRQFKKLILKEGLLKDLKRHAHFEKPGDRKRRKTREAIRRRRRQAARTRARFGGEDE